MDEVGNGIYRLGSDLVNWFVVEDGGKLTLIDAGLPKQYHQLPSALDSLGRTLADVDAIVLTHAHGDHIGSSAEIVDATGSVVYAHHDEEMLARGEMEADHEEHWAKGLTSPFAWKTAWEMLRGGALSAPPVVDLTTFSDAETIDVPGRPRAIHTPGHTDGSACLYIEGRSALFTGDALVTLHIGNGSVQPRVMPRAFNKSSEDALGSLSNLEGLGVATVYPGHGAQWDGDVSEMVSMARSAGPS